MLGGNHAQQGIQADELRPPLKLSIDPIKTGTPFIVMTFLTAMAVAVAALIHGAGHFEWNRFYFWVNAPYVALAILFALPLSQSRPRAMAGCIAAVLVLAATAHVYIRAMWFSASSTSALAFVFTPVCLFVGGLVIWAASWGSLAWRSTGGSRAT